MPPDLVDRLTIAGCVAAEEEASELVAGAPDPATLEAWLQRREHGEPLAWIVGSTQFGDRSIAIDPGVYVPRLQSEDMAKRAARALPDKGWAADLCTGSGSVAVILMAQVPSATVIGIDIDPRAAACARRNGVRAVVGDLDLPVGRPHGFDLVTAVAPYVPTAEIGYLPRDVRTYEPRVALDGGRDGLDLIRRVVGGAARLLRPGGWLFVELGGKQDVLLRSFLAAAGFDHVESTFDDDGDLRSLAARFGPGG